MGHLKFRTYSIAIAFVACISFPFVNDRLKLFSDIKSFENRQPKSEPGMDINHLDDYPMPYEAYYNDHFTLRSLIIKFYNYYKILMFKSSPIPNKVIIGNNGWLFTGSEEFDSYMGRNRFKPEELEAYAKELDHRKKYLEERGCKFYFLIAPGKSSIHSKHIRYQYRPVTKQTWGEQLTEYLNKNSNVKPIDVYGTLRARADREELYYKLDNHWNSLGAFYTANEIIKTMAKDFPDLQELNRSDFTLTKKEIGNGNMQQMLGDLKIFTDIEVQLKPKKSFLAKDAKKMNYPSVDGFAYPFEYEIEKEIKGSKKPKLLVISDSFGKAIFPFLAEHFSRSVKIFDAWQYKLNEDIVEKEKPDAVLLLIDEPILKNLLNFQARLPKK